MNDCVRLVRMSVAVKTGTTFFGYEALNRVSFLRNDLEFVRSSLNHRSTVFIPFVGGEALLSDNDTLCQLTLKDDRSLDHVIGKVLPLLNTESVRLMESGVNLTFLGLRQGKEDIGNANAFSYRSIYRGTPYYAIDFHATSRTLIKPTDITSFLKLQKVDRNSMFTMSNEVASLYSHAKMYLNWLAKYKFCPGCGSIMYPVDAGTKMHCGNKDKTVTCDVRDAKVNNVCFPRTDPVVIVAIATRDFSKICLARSKRKFNDHVMYSTIAGFMEPAETIENACSREIWEETGIKCAEIALISSQPWPYPVNLMIGCVGIIDFNGENEVINLSHDEELLDAQWFDTKDVAESLESYSGKGLVKFKNGNITFPGATAIAFHLIKFVCDKYKRSQGSL